MVDEHAWRQSGETTGTGWDDVPIYLCDVCGAHVASYDYPSKGMRIKVMTNILPAWKMPSLSDAEWSALHDRFQANFPSGATCLGGLLWLAKLGVTTQLAGVTPWG